MSAMSVVVTATNWNDTVWGALVVPIAAAGIAAVVVVLGYLYDRGNKRKDDRRTLFSDALAAIADYQELPYRIRRRSDTSPMTPSDIAALAGNVQSRLDLFVARLQLESRELGECYLSLVGAVRKEAGAHMTDAWKQPRIEADSEMPLGTRYPRDQADAARARCIELMQSYIGVRACRG